MHPRRSLRAPEGRERRRRRREPHDDELDEQEQQLFRAGDLGEPDRVQRAADDERKRDDHLFADGRGSVLHEVHPDELLQGAHGMRSGAFVRRLS
jgi:hypothetical protein